MKLNSFLRSKYVLTLLISLFFFIELNAQVDYDWRNVPIGGGGYIIGMKIHPDDPQLIYYRTDIGGAYKWNPQTNRLEQLIYSAIEGHYSVAGIALHPTKKNEVYLAVDRNCDYNSSAIFKSTNFGQDWEIVDAPVVFAANGGRNCSGNSDDKDRQGTPLEINPNNPLELFIGSRGDGLWKMNTSTNQFTRIAENIIPSNPNRKSIRSVVFHPIQKKFVFVGYADFGVYMGDVNANTYWKIDANIADLKEISDISISKNGDQLFVACKKAGIYKCSNPVDVNRIWNKVQADIGTNNDGEGYLTVTCSPHNNAVVATCTGDYNALSKFQISTNNGNTGSWQLRPGTVTENYVQWKTSGHGSHISQIAFDPVDPNKLYFTSWFSSFHTNDWTASNISWGNYNAVGHEEVVVTDMTAFPTNTEGNFLGHLGADETGFIVGKIQPNDYPTKTIRSSLNDATNIVKGASIDFCESNPDVIVVSLTRFWDDYNPDQSGSIFRSTNGGKNFTRSTEYQENLGKSVVAISSTDPNRVVIANTRGVQYSSNGGNKFFDANGSGVSGQKIHHSVFSVMRPIASDKVQGNVFYFYDWLTGNFHKSIDYGQNWTQVSSGLPTYKNNDGSTSNYKHKTRLQSIPSKVGHLWINFNNDLFRSTNGGSSWTRISNVQIAKLVGFGKEAPGSDYATLYLFGKANGDSQNAYYRSTNQGATWEKINNPAEDELYGDPKILTGDRNEFGRVYVSAGGLGLITAAPKAQNNNSIELSLKAFLSGCYDEQSGLMSDNLRQQNLIPLNEPYQALPTFNHISGGGEVTTGAVLNATGQNAIVDWVFIEIRSSENPANVIVTRSGLLQRDGDVVDTNGSDPLKFEGLDSGSYYVSVRHRNHLGAMIANAVNLSQGTPININFTNVNLSNYSLSGLMGSLHGQKVIGNVKALWAGNSTIDGKLIYQGAENDAQAVFFSVLQDPQNTGSFSNYIQSGYHVEDTNLDGTVIFNGAENEPNQLFFEILLNPANTSLQSNFIVWEQIP